MASLYMLDLSTSLEKSYSREKNETVRTSFSPSIASSLTADSASPSSPSMNSPSTPSAAARVAEALSFHSRNVRKLDEAHSTARDKSDAAERTELRLGEAKRIQDKHIQDQQTNAEQEINDIRMFAERYGYKWADKLKACRGTNKELDEIKSCEKDVRAQALTYVSPNTKEVEKKNAENVEKAFRMHEDALKEAARAHENVNKYASRIYKVKTATSATDYQSKQKAATEAATLVENKKKAYADVQQKLEDAKRALEDAEKDQEEKAYAAQLSRSNLYTAQHDEIKNRGISRHQNQDEIINKKQKAANRMMGRFVRSKISDNRPYKLTNLASCMDMENHGTTCTELGTEKLLWKTPRTFFDEKSCSQTKEPINPSLSERYGLPHGKKCHVLKLMSSY